MKKPYFKISKAPKPWFARFLVSVAVVERTTFYLAQSCLHCYFLDQESKFLKIISFYGIQKKNQLTKKYKKNDLMGTGKKSTESLKSYIASVPF